MNIAPIHEMLRSVRELRGHGCQLPLYAAVAFGFRKAMDDWWPLSNVDELCLSVQRAGLSVELDCIFDPLTDRVHGQSYAPTTRAAARLYSPGTTGSPQSKVHVFVGRCRAEALDALQCGWYSLAVNGRVVRRPLVDNARLGRAFGYPECCVDFFIQKNNIPLYNSYAEAKRASRQLLWQCNALRKGSELMTIFHLPCSFDCVRTVEYTENLLKEIAQLDSLYAGMIEEAMKRTCLALSETYSCAFINAHVNKEGEVVYAAVEDLCERASARTLRDEERTNLLRRGDRFMIRDSLVVVKKGAETIGVIEARIDLGPRESAELFPFASE